MRKPYTDSERKTIVASRAAGKKWEAIADTVGRPKDVVRLVIYTYWFKELMQDLQVNDT